MSYNFYKPEFTIQEILLSLALSFGVILSLKFDNIIILSGLFLILFMFYKKTITVPVIIIIFLTATGPSIEKIRDYITLGGVLILVYLFLKKNGTDYRSYAKVPVEVVYFTFYLLFSIIITTILTGLNSNSLAAIVRIVIFLSLCYIFYSFIENKKIMYEYIISLLIASIIICISIYFEIASTGISNFLIKGQLARFAGSYGNPNYVGLLLIITTSLIVSILFNEKINIKMWQKIILWLTLLNNVIIILVINSRAATLAILLSISFILYNIKRKYFIRGIIIAAASIGVIFLIPAVQDFFLLFIRLDTVGERGYFWNAGLAMISDHPLIGVGPDMFLSKFYSYLPSSASFLIELANTGVKPSPHNFILYFTSEMGVLGFIAALYIFGLFFYLGIKSIISLKVKDKEYYLLAVTITGIGMGIFIRSFYEVDGVLTYGYITRDLAFWIIYIIQIFIYQRSKEENSLIMRDLSIDI